MTGRSRDRWYGHACLATGTRTYPGSGAQSWAATEVRQVACGVGGRARPNYLGRTSYSSLTLLVDVSTQFTRRSLSSAVKTKTRRRKTACTCRRPYNDRRHVGSQASQVVDHGKNLYVNYRQKLNNRYNFTFPDLVAQTSVSLVACRLSCLF